MPMLTLDLDWEPVSLDEIDPEWLNAGADADEDTKADFLAELEDSEDAENSGAGEKTTDERLERAKKELREKIAQCDAIPEITERRDFLIWIGAQRKAFLTALEILENA